MPDRNRDILTPEEIREKILAAIYLLDELPEDYYKPVDDLITDGYNCLDDALTALSTITPETSGA